MIKRLAILQFSVVLAMSAEASVPALVIGEQPAPVVNIAPYAEFLVDPSADLQIGQVSTAPWSDEFKPRVQNPPSFGFTRAAVWMRCEVRSVGTEAEMVRFELRSARISEVIWYVVADGRVEKSVAGGLAERAPAFGRYPAIEFELPPGQTRTVFARAVSDTSLLLPFEAGSPAVMQQVEWRRSAVDLLLVGFCLAAAAFLAMSGFTQRQPMFFYLALFALAYAGYYAIFYGYVAEFWPGRPFWIERGGFGVASALGIFAFLRFNGTYLDTRTMARHERALQRTAEGLMLLGAGLFAVLDFRRAMSLLNLFMALSLILATVVIVLRARHHRERDEIWFFLTWLAFTVCIALLAWQFTKALPVAIPLHVLQKLLIPSILAAFFLVASARQRSLQRLQIQLAETEARRSLAEEERDAKTLFLAEVSHEIRTPLSALVGLSQAMWMRCSTREVDPEFTQFLNRVRSGGQYLSLLLRNVLNVSAAESGRVPVRLTAFYLADWAGEIRNILEPIADFHHGRIAWALPDNDEARLCTDEMRLTQIILNLAENALKFGSGGGEPVAIALEKTSCGLRVVVEDRGPGIESERLDAVFAEFEQADGGQGTPMATGVGLGLAVVKLNTGLLGGALHVDKSASGGMRFEVEIPDRTDQLSAAPTAAEPPPDQPA
jgi:signal transduction histidine kinase